MLRALWRRVWFAPAHPLCLTATRVILCAQALWILLSRPDLPALAHWPRAFFRLVPALLPLRFGFGLPAAFEWALFALAFAAVLAALGGLWPRASCLAAGLLLYHFAPLEELVAGLPHTAFGGLSVPALGLCILAFADSPRWRGAPSPDHRWPFALIQLLFAFGYFFPTLAKLRFAGPLWFTGENIHYYLLGNFTVTGAPLALALASHPLLCRAVALGTLALEVTAPLVVVSPRFALLFVPAALLFHTGIVLTIGYFFPSLPLLLLLVDWDALGRALARSAP